MLVGPLLRLHCQGVRLRRRPGEHRGHIRPLCLLDGLRAGCRDQGLPERRLRRDARRPGLLRLHQLQNLLLRLLQRIPDELLLLRQPFRRLLQPLQLLLLLLRLPLRLLRQPLRRLLQLLQLPLRIPEGLLLLPYVLRVSRRCRRRAVVPPPDRVAVLLQRELGRLLLVVLVPFVKLLVFFQADLFRAMRRSELDG